MRQLAAWTTGLLLSLTTLGCQVPHAAPTTAEVPVQVRLAVGGYRVQALIKPLTVRDVDHVVLTATKAGTTVARTSVPALDLGRPVALHGLKMATTYTIQAVAYRDAAETAPISDPAGSRTTFTTPAIAPVNGVAAISADPVPVSIPVKLVDQVYRGQATVSVVTVRRVNQVRVTLWRDGAIAYQAPAYAVTDFPDTRSLNLTNLKPGVAVYRIQVEGLNRGGNSVASVETSFSTLPVEGAFTDLLGPYELSLN